MKFGRVSLSFFDISLVSLYKVSVEYFYKVLFLRGKKAVVFFLHKGKKRREIFFIITFDKCELIDRFLNT